MAESKEQVLGIRQQPRRRCDATYASAAHEAGHVIVAHALGRHVLVARIGGVELPPGHPSNPLEVASVSAGFHLAGPSLTAEINECFEAGVPFTAHQVDWLRSEIIVAFAGRIAECFLTGQADVPAWAAEGDLIQAGHVARMLGKAETRPDGEIVYDVEFLIQAHRVSGAILADLTPNLTCMADLLSVRPVAEYPEETIQMMLAELGSPEGSHRHLLATLVDVG